MQTRRMEPNDSLGQRLVARPTFHRHTPADSTCRVKLGPASSTPAALSASSSSSMSASASSTIEKGRASQAAPNIPRRPQKCIIVAVEDVSAASTAHVAKAGSSTGLHSGKEVPRHNQCARCATKSKQLARPSVAMPMMRTRYTERAMTQRSARPSAKFLNVSAGSHPISTRTLPVPRAADSGCCNSRSKACLLRLALKRKAWSSTRDADPRGSSSTLDCSLPSKTSMLRTKLSDWSRNANQNSLFHCGFSLATHRVRRPTDC
mmetsp:Transcript_118706/g.236434  ORF Transcript_118706/g.236434 Transcript_118706/m.236434 type:complete len:263 (+) Transcript_118706:980-1768(+)